MRPVHVLLTSFTIFILIGSYSRAAKPLTNELAGFIENKGQVYDLKTIVPLSSVKATVMVGGMTVFFHENFVSYQVEKGADIPMDVNAPFGTAMKVLDKREVHRVDIKPLNSSNNPVFLMDGRKSDEVRFTRILKNDMVSVSIFDKVIYKDIYPGIDWVWFIKEGKLKHEFHVQAGADYHSIQLMIVGDNGFDIDKTGSLRIKTQFGEIEEESPISFQSGNRLESHFKKSNNVLSYEVAANSRDKLIIDPTLLWSTYYGSNGNEQGIAIDADSSGNLYVGGITSSNQGFANVPGFSTYGGSTWDACIVKYSPAGARIWSAYIGGAGTEYGYGIDVSPNGHNIALVGYTSSSNGIAYNAFDSTVSGVDAYVVVMTDSGTRNWGTYFGGTGSEEFYAVRYDSIGNLYLVGTTSSDSISTEGAHQVSRGGGGSDGLVVKFGIFGQLLWSTYYGGIGSEYVSDIGELSNGDIVFSGATTSSSGISTQGSFQPNRAGTSKDNFIVRMNANGIRQWGTYFGGSGTEESYHMRIDFRDHIYHYGTTTSLSGVDSAAFQTNYGGGGADALILCLTPFGQRVWSSYLGGNGFDQGRGMAVDNYGNTFYVGHTSSSNFPLLSSLQNNFNGGTYDMHLTKVDTNGIKGWSTYFGGTGLDVALGAVVVNNSLHIVGHSDVDFPIQNAPQPMPGGSYDIVLFAFNYCEDIFITPSDSGIICFGDTVTLTASPGFASYMWSNGDTTRSIQVVATGSYSVAATSVNMDCQSISANLLINVAPPLMLDTIYGDLNPVYSLLTSYGVTQNQALTYHWQVDGGTILSGQGTNIILVAWFRMGAGSVELTASDSVGCSGSLFLPINIVANTGVHDMDQNIIQVYPNPTEDFAGFYWEEDRMLSIRISDLFGKLVLEQRDPLASGLKVDLSHYPDGIYIYQLQTESGRTIIGKLLKKH